VLVTDYHLDGENTGLELLDALRKHLGTEVPGIVLTGDLPSLLRRTGTQPAGCRFLPKPVDTQALIQAINDLSAKARESQLPGKVSAGE
jgi:two-component system, sensor histidine kinase